MKLFGGLLRIKTFHGAGWSWRPGFSCGRWYAGLTFHFHRGLLVYAGWSEAGRQMRKRLRAMTPEQRQEMRKVIESVLNEEKSP